ncbi:MAG TPA: APC family permease [Thermoanaerobaculia bacterium]|nr:APC family permease [Thermoanaerobaculia bacterium]
MSEIVSPVTHVGFRRAVSRWEIVAFSLNDVIGSGVYLLPALVAAILGPTSMWAVVLAGFAVALLVLCFAEAGSYFDGPGGAYLYTREAFGELVGFEVGWMTWLARVSSVASLSVAFAQALTYLLPQTKEGTGRTLAIVLPLLLLTAINLVGVKAGVRTAVFLAVSKILPLLLFAGVGIFYVSRTLATLPTPRTGTLGEAALLLLFAYAGFENTPAPAGEFKNPRRDVPFALVANIVIVTLIYSAVQWVALGTLPNLAGSETPLADAARLFLGGWGGVLLTIGALLSILGTNSNTVLAGPRYLWALAADGFGPRMLTYIHPRFRTPTVAILTQTAIALPLALSGSFTQLATLSVVARLATYFGTAAAVLKLRRKFPDAPNVMRTPGGPVIPIAALFLCLAFAASAETRDLIAGAIALVVGFLLYLIRRQPEESISSDRDS